MNIQKPQNVIALERAVAVLGSQSALARLLGKEQGHVSHWLKSGLPAAHCPVIEQATRAAGQPVLCEELCPAVPWGILREQIVTPDAVAAMPEAESAA